MNTPSTDPWTYIADTAWWQVVLSLVTAFTVAVFAHVFLERRNKRKIIREAAAKMMSAGMAYRSAYTAFVEYDTDFATQQQHLVNSKKDNKAFEVHKEAAFWSQKVALDFRGQSEKAKSEFIESGYLLSSMLSKRLTNDKSFQKAVKDVLGLRQASYKGKDFEEAKIIIDKKLMPPLRIIEKVCQQIIRDHSGIF